MGRTGVLLIDKPRGPSSHQVAAWVKNMLKSEVGHAGTLDPGVSGVLVVMLGKAVRLAQLLLQHEKEYVACMRLHADIPRKQVEEAIRGFTGRIYQRPPRRSAVKRSLRIRVIHAIEILDMQDRLVLIRVQCEAGTYIRSICTHIGNVLGCGAQMIELRRTMSGGFSVDQAYTLQEIRDAVEEGTIGEMILPPEKAITGIPKITIRNTASEAVLHGAELAVPGIISADSFKKGSSVVLVNQEGKLIALAKTIFDADKIPDNNGIVAQSLRVFSA